MKNQNLIFFVKQKKIYIYYKKCQQVLQHNQAYYKI